ncbi:MAG: DUF3160 domain-containing protein [Candidatus Falkowbacteria bacterium]|nr:DUF3160 domain-containing protein [Candidatus Falkowbacteria bacterium]
MNKFNRKYLLLIAAVLILAVLAFLIYKKYYTPKEMRSDDAVQTVLDESTVASNEPNIGFTPSYQEQIVPLASVANYQAIKNKYGLNLSEAQEKYLEANHFLLINSEEVPFFSAGNNFDQWLVDADAMGGGAIYERKPEDAVLVTPDTVLHAYHKYFELTLEQLEQHELSQELGNFLSGLHANLALASKNSKAESKTRYQNLEAQIVLARILFENKNVAKPSYFAAPEEEQKYTDQDKTVDSLANAKKLLTKYSKDLTPQLTAAISSDLTEIYSASKVGASPLFKQYDDQIKTDYTQFTPRSHYNKNSTLRAFFRTMMYLGRSSYLLNSPLGIADTNLLVKQMSLKNGSSAAPLEAWTRISNVTSFYAGQSDDISYNEYKTFETSILGNNLNSDEELISKDNVNKLATNLDKLRKPKILSDVIIDENIASLTKEDLLKQSLAFRVFGQKFTFDAWILNDLTAGQEKTEVRLPSMPSALFVPAAFGDQQAKQYTGEFLQQSANFSQTDLDGFFTKLDKKKADINKVTHKEWFDSLGSSWLYILGSLTHDYGKHYPSYMQVKPFLSKQIQSFLGSYAELKHDTLLYAKQSYAELGAGGEDKPLPPIVKGFVEPNLEFWNRFSALLDRTDKLFKDNGVFKEGDAIDRLGQFKESVALYTGIAEKELRSQAISDDDYEKLRTTKLSFMAQPFETIDPTPTSGQTALIADIHTDMVQNKILYEATAKPYFMLAIVANDNLPRVTAGLVYNHYELTDQLSQRLSDETWKDRVYNNNSLLPTKNFWYQSLLVK